MYNTKKNPSINLIDNNQLCTLYPNNIKAAFICHSKYPEILKNATNIINFIV